MSTHGRLLSACVRDWVEGFYSYRATVNAEFVADYPGALKTKLQVYCVLYSDIYNVQYI